MFSHKLVYFVLAFAACAGAQNTAHVALVKVESHSAARTIPLTAELLPYLQTDIEARVPGYVEQVLVDRGSVVHRGELLVLLSAPEMRSETNASESTLRQAEADEAQAKAQAAAAASTYTRLQEAAKTPGAVAGNELVLAEKEKDAADSVLQSRTAAVRSAKARMQATGEMESYLRVRAPFDGTITDRFVHPGMMVDPNGHTPMLKLQQTTHLRLAVPVPESYVGSIVKGGSVTFQVPAHPGKSYTGKIARIANALDPQSRTMMVELDVSDKTLAPGMYPTVDWPVGSNDMYSVRSRHERGDNDGTNVCHHGGRWACSLDQCAQGSSGGRASGDPWTDRRRSVGGQARYR